MLALTVIFLDIPEFGTQTYEILNGEPLSDVRLPFESTSTEKLFGSVYNFQIFSLATTAFHAALRMIRLFYSCWHSSFLCTNPCLDKKPQQEGNDERSNNERSNDERSNGERSNDERGDDERGNDELDDGTRRMSETTAKTVENPK